MKKMIILYLLLFVSGLTAQIPLLDSDPSVTNRVIYLDFDGQVVTGTSWNTSNNTPTINAAPSTLSQASIIQVWKRVSEDYRPFGVNVTTDVAKFNAAPANRRIRVIITPTSSWYPNSAGGVAYLNSFSWGGNPDTPCWVFENALSYNAKNVAEAASHEVGHTLSLRHQSVWNSSCVKTAEYNPGVGSGVTSWAPIMGVGYSKNVTIWHNGTNSQSCTTLQFDHGTSGITGPNFLSYRTDDVGNNLSTSKLLVLNSALVVDSGIISTPTDIDVFKFDLCNNRYVTIDVKPWALDTVNYSGANLDVRLTLVNANTSATLAVDTPLTKLNARIGMNLTPGSYYFVVDGGGSANYSDYGSLGLYYIRITSNNVPSIISNFNFSGNLCTGSSIQLTDASSGNPTTWSWTITGASPPLSNVQNPQVTYNSPGTYSITLSATNSTASTCPVTKTIQITASPTVNLSASPSVICNGQSANLTASGASSYAWSTGSTGSFITVSPSVNTIYSVTGTSGGCTKTQTISIQVNPLPNINITSTADTLCAGNSATLTSSGATSYSWSTGATSSSIVVTPTSNTTYFVTGSLSTGCSGSNNYYLIVLNCMGLSNTGLIPYHLIVYPNPVNDMFQINYQGIPSSNDVLIYNSLGQIVMKLNHLRQNDFIDVSTLGPGIYLIILSHDGHVIGKTNFIKN
jgi:PKD repeat protein